MALNHTFAIPIIDITTTLQEELDYHHGPAPHFTHLWKVGRYQHAWFACYKMHYMETLYAGTPDEEEVERTYFIIKTMLLPGKSKTDHSWTVLQGKSPGWWNTHSQIKAPYTLLVSTTKIDKDYWDPVLSVDEENMIAGYLSQSPTAPANTYYIRTDATTSLRWTVHSTIPYVPDTTPPLTGDRTALKYDMAVDQPGYVYRPFRTHVEGIGNNADRQDKIYTPSTISGLARFGLYREVNPTYTPPRQQFWVALPIFGDGASHRLTAKFRIPTTPDANDEDYTLFNTSTPAYVVITKHYGHGVPVDGWPNMSNTTYGASGVSKHINILRSNIGLVPEKSESLFISIIYTDDTMTLNPTMDVLVCRTADSELATQRPQHEHFANTSVNHQPGYLKVIPLVREVDPFALSPVSLYSVAQRNAAIYLRPYWQEASTDMHIATKELAVHDLTVPPASGILNVANHTPIFMHDANGRNKLYLPVTLISCINTTHACIEIPVRESWWVGNQNKIDEITHVQVILGRTRPGMFKPRPGLLQIYITRDVWNGHNISSNAAVGKGVVYYNLSSDPSNTSPPIGVNSLLVSPTKHKEINQSVLRSGEHFATVGYNAPPIGSYPLKCYPNLSRHEHLTPFKTINSYHGNIRLYNHSQQSAHQPKVVLNWGYTSSGPKFFKYTTDVNLMLTPRDVDVFGRTFVFRFAGTNNTPGSLSLPVLAAVVTLTNHEFMGRSGGTTHRLIATLHKVGSTTTLKVEHTRHNGSSWSTPIVKGTASSTSFTHTSGHFHIDFNVPYPTNNVSGALLFNHHATNVGAPAPIVDKNYALGVQFVDSIKLVRTHGSIFRSTTDDVKFVIPDTIAWNNNTKPGVLRVYCNGFKDGGPILANYVIFPSLFDIDRIHVRYNDTTGDPPAPLNDNEHCLVISFDPSNGTVTALTYHWRFSGGSQYSWDLNIVSTDHESSSYPNPIIIPTKPEYKRSFTGMPGGSPKCYPMNLSKPAVLSNYGSLQDRRVYILRDPSVSGYGKASVVMSFKTFMRNSSIRNTMGQWYFNVDINLPSSVTKAAYISKPDTPSSFPIIGQDTVAISRVDNWYIKAWIPNGTGHTATANSSHPDLLRDGFTGTSQWEYPVCGVPPVTTIGPGRYKIRTSVGSGVVLERNDTPGNLASDRGVRLKIAATIAFNDNTKTGTVEALLPNVPGEAAGPVYGTIRDLDVIHVSYNDAAPAPGYIGSGKHGLVISFNTTTGDMTNMKYYRNSSSGSTSVTVGSSTYNPAGSAISVYKTSTSWTSGYTSYSSSGSCRLVSLVKSSGSNAPSSIQDRKIYLINNPSGSGYNKAYIMSGLAILQHFKLEKKAIGLWCFNTSLSTSATKARFMTADSITNANAEQDTIIVTRNSDFKLSVYLPNGTGHSLTATSAAVDFWTDYYSGGDQWAYPACPVPIVVPPGTYSLSPTSIKLRSLGPNSYSTDSHDIEIEVSGATAFGDGLIGGKVVTRISSISGETADSILGAMADLNKIYVSYDNASAPSPITLGSGKHGLAVSYSKASGDMIGAKYYWNTGGSSGEEVLVIVSNTHSTSPSTPKVYTNVPPWSKNISGYSPAAYCKTMNLKFLNNGASLSGGNTPKDGTIFVVRNSSGAGHAKMAVYTSLRTYMGFSSTKKVMVMFRFDVSIANISGMKAKFITRDVPVTGFYPDNQTIFFVRDSNWTMKVYVPSGTSHTLLGTSARMDYVKPTYSNISVIYPACENPFWDVPHWWPFEHSNAGAPAVMDESVIYIEHASQNRKIIFIPRAFHNQDDQDNVVYSRSINKVDTTRISNKVFGVMSRLPGMMWYPSGDAETQLPNPPANTATMAFSAVPGTALKYKLVTKTTDRNNVTTTATLVVTTVSVGSHSTSNNISTVVSPSPIDYQLSDWERKALVVKLRTGTGGTPTYATVTDYNELSVWKTSSYIRMALNTKHTDGSNNIHAELVKFDLPAAALSAITDGMKMCVWDDTDSVSDIPAALVGYMPDTFVIARLGFGRTKLYYVNPPVGGGGSVITTVDGIFTGYMFNGTTLVNNGAWPAQNCTIFNIDGTWFGSKRIVPNLPSLSDTDEVSIAVHGRNFSTRKVFITINLIEGWKTGRYIHRDTHRVTFEIDLKHEVTMTNLDFVIMDPRGTLDLSLNSDLYAYAGSYDIGDIEVVFARDALDKLHLHIVEVRGDGVPIVDSYDTHSTTVLGNHNLNVVMPTEANIYVYNRTDINLGGVMNDFVDDQLPNDLYADNIYYHKWPSPDNWTKMAITFVAPVNTSLNNKNMLWRTIYLPRAAIENDLEYMGTIIFTCVTNVFIPPAPGPTLPDDTDNGAIVISKGLIHSVNVHVRRDDSWVFLGLFELHDTNTVATIDPVTFSKPTCDEHLRPVDCTMGMLPVMNSSQSLPLNWEIVDDSNIHVSGGEYVMYNREGNNAGGEIRSNNMQATYDLPNVNAADSIRLRFRRKPTGNTGYFTSVTLSAPTRLFVYITDAAPEDIDFSQGFVPKAPSGEMIYIALPIREVPSVSVHTADEEITDLALVNYMPEMTYDYSDASLLKDGLQDMEIVLAKNGNSATIWIYESGRIIARTKREVALPWLSTGTIGIHAHSTAPGTYIERITDTSLAYGKLTYGCLPPGVIVPNIGCDMVPDVSEQSIHTSIPDTNVVTEIYKPLPAIIYAYVHIDVVNVSNTNALVTLYRGDLDGTNLEVLRELKPMEIDELVEIHSLRVLPEKAIFCRTLAGSVTIRVSSIEELY